MRLLLMIVVIWVYMGSIRRSEGWWDLSECTVRLEPEEQDFPLYREVLGQLGNESTSQWTPYSVQICIQVPFILPQTTGKWEMTGTTVENGTEVSFEMWNEGRLSRRSVCGGKTSCSQQYTNPPCVANSTTQGEGWWVVRAEVDPSTIAKGLTNVTLGIRIDNTDWIELSGAQIPWGMGDSLGELPFSAQFLNTVLDKDATLFWSIFLALDVNVGNNNITAYNAFGSEGSCRLGIPRVIITEDHQAYVSPIVEYSQIGKNSRFWVVISRNYISDERFVFIPTINVQYAADDVSSSRDHDLDTAQIVGIVVGVVSFLVVISAAGAIYWLRQKQRVHYEGIDTDDDDSYDDYN